MPARMPLLERVRATLHSRRGLVADKWLAAGTAGLWLGWEDDRPQDEGAATLAGLQLLRGALAARYGEPAPVKVNAETGEPWAEGQPAGYMAGTLPDSDDSRTDPDTRTWQVSVYFLRDVAAECGNSALAALIDASLAERAKVRVPGPVAGPAAGGAPHEAERQPKAAERQQTAVLQALLALSYDPMQLPPFKRGGPSEAKSHAARAVEKLGMSRATFEQAWKALAKDRRIAYRRP